MADAGADGRVLGLELSPLSPEPFQFGWRQRTGAEEIAGLGFGEDVDAEADVVPPSIVEELAMLLGQ